MGIEVKTGVAKTGVVGILKGGKAGLSWHFAPIWTHYLSWNAPMYRLRPIPNLETVDGHLSIDAVGVVFPKLQLVNGDCNIHEKYILLPNLKEVKGKLKILQPTVLFALEKVGNKIENKCKVRLPNLILSTKPLIEIKNQSEVRHLSEDGLFNLVVTGNDITIHHQVILGNITIRGNRVQFPNLLEAQKVLIGAANNDTRSLKIIQNIDFPQLTKIHDNCLIAHAQNITFPVLKEIDKKLLLNYKSTAEFLNLEKVGFFECGTEVNLHFPKLKLVEGDFRYSNFDKNNPIIACPELEVVQGTFMFLNAALYPKLKQIRILEMYQQAIANTDTYLPKLELVKYAIYNPCLGTLTKHIEHLFFRISNIGYVSTTEFIVASIERTIFKEPRIPINTLIAILKMRRFRIFIRENLTALGRKPMKKFKSLRQ